MTWTAAETNTHQDHVIAHVIGATPLGHFFWDETAYIVLDIGFIWNIYLDLEMGLVPHRLAISELEADDETQREFSEVRNVVSSPIESGEVFEDGDERRMVINCELDLLFIETSLSHRFTRIHTDKISDL
ncbi:MAG TPA: hypothetical protein VF290_06950 [Pyrinomonadaceae bacterium]